VKALPSLVDLTVAKGRHITVCGDTHGQFFDLMHIFALNGNPSATNPYVFNGDFVDRGSWSVEVIVTLMASKVLEPECIQLTRGNHEALSLNKIYGFEGEVKAKYNTKLMDIFRCCSLGGPRCCVGL
jgi:serine/threonine-protein phosphatase 5